MGRTAKQKLRFHWQLEWRTAVFTAICVPLFVGLGFWQLARAEEKRLIAGLWEQRWQLPPVAIGTLPVGAEQIAYRQVTLRGRFLTERSFLLDNRIRQGRYGVEVISPFLVEDSQQLVLVNRGWLQADPARRSLPAVPAVAGMDGEMRLTGYVYVSPGDSYTLGELSSDVSWPRLVQAVDVTALGGMLGQDVFPFTVRLSADSPASLLADWPLLNARPEKHRAYAVQWFSMALVLALFFVWRSSNLRDIYSNKN